MASWSYPSFCRQTAQLQMHFLLHKCGVFHKEWSSAALSFCVDDLPRHSANEGKSVVLGSRGILPSAKGASKHKLTLRVPQKQVAHVVSLELDTDTAKPCKPRKLTNVSRITIVSIMNIPHHLFVTILTPL